MKKTIGWVLPAALLALAACDDGEGPSNTGDDGGDGGGAGGSGGDGGGGSGGQPGWLSAPVQVTFDADGVPYIQGRTDRDVIASLGYLHAQNRFFQMDLFRRVGRGQIAGLISLQLSSDVFLRKYFSTAEGVPLEDAVYDLLSDDEKADLQAYADGVNAWLADARAGRNGARLTEEYELALLPNDPAELRDWEPKDSIAFARYMTFDLSDSNGDGVAYGNLFAALDPAVAPDLMTLRPAAESYTMPASGVEYAPLRNRPDVQAIRQIQERLLAARKVLREVERQRAELTFFLKGPNAQPWETGSNNWVVGPGKSASGHPLLANDPHLGLGNPAIWYFAVLDSKTAGEGGTLHVGGASFPAGPVIPIGRNEDVAWGATVVGYDVTDAYVETLNADGQEPQTRTLEWVPHHGPILAKDVASRTAVTSRWTGQEPTLEIRTLGQLMRATSVADAKEILKGFSTGAQNWVLVDRQGAIGWYPHAKVPLRPWAAATAGRAPWMPLPGDGTAEWQGYMESDDLPQLFDPPAGFIATANQDATGDTEDGDPSNDGHNLLQSDPDLGFRHARIVELLRETDQHTPETMRTIAADTRSLPGAMLVPHLVAAANADPAAVTEDARTVIAALSAWNNFTCPTGLAGSDPQGAVSEDLGELDESAGCMAFHYTLNSLFHEAFGDELEAAGGGVGQGAAGSQRLFRALVLLLERPAEAASGEALWDDVSTAGVVETRDEILRRALDRAGSELRTRIGPPSAWQWGKKHTVTFASQLHDLSNGVLSDGPYANDGGLFTVDVANIPTDGSGYAHSAGASLRIVNEATPDGIVTSYQYAGGQDLHRDAPTYGKLVDRWLANEPTPLAFTAEEAEAAKASELTLAP